MPRNRRHPVRERPIRPTASSRTPSQSQNGSPGGEKEARSPRLRRGQQSHDLDFPKGIFLYASLIHQGREAPVSSPPSSQISGKQMFRKQWPDSRRTSIATGVPRSSKRFPQKFDGTHVPDEPGLAELEKISFSFQTWCLCITRWVLRSRTAFAQYLSKTLHLCRDGPPASPTALFPLPLPNERILAARDLEGTKSEKADQALDRALHVVVCALNYLYSASSFCEFELLKRQPNFHQRRALAHLRLLLQACDPGRPVHVESSGRKNLQLLARLQELAVAADALGIAGDPYSRERSGHPVPKNDSINPKLSPFSSLNAGRLKISGRGQWDAASYMPVELEMSFKEPQVLELDFPIYSRGQPNILCEDPVQVFDLFKKWDSLGLLTLHAVSAVGGEHNDKVKIFNAFKSQEWDRQIGDRRLRNAVEARLPGPSKELPCGPLLTRLCIPHGHGVKVCVTDRSDFYHQMMVSHERSRTNCVWPPMELGKFRGLKAWSSYVDRASKVSRPIDRNVHGDQLHGVRPSDKSVGDATLVFGAFNSVLQGDHLGVEYGIASHARFLEEHGLLADRGRLLSSSLVKPSSLYEGLVIDDYFSLAVVPQLKPLCRVLGAECCAGIFPSGKESVCLCSFGRLRCQRCG